MITFLTVGYNFIFHYWYARHFLQILLIDETFSFSSRRTRDLVVSRALFVYSGDVFSSAHIWIYKRIAALTCDAYVRHSISQLIGFVVPNVGDKTTNTFVWLLCRKLNNFVRARRCCGQWERDDVYICPKD